MSEEKLYAVKNDEGKYWDFEGRDDFWALVISDCPTTPSKEQAELVADEQGGHVVTFVEEPEKVVLTKEQAKIVKDAHDNKIPACHIANKSDDEELLMNAYVNGYTVAKEKEYNVKVPYAINSYFKKIGVDYCIAGYKDTVDLDENVAQFTESEIEHYGLQDCEKEEVTDDEQ
ncbi:hypothetical protein [Lacticaseibacillus phage P7.1]|uniref:DUF1642 domain-containing protein n=1 Tax=Lacticaseibacillus paracasei TaxID=1597 RepID=UPI002916E3E0|nr:DUF1642 domain-containing protein [Lacticaseibacillus paracasei]WBM89782.1 hypothetical protein [Lacticaseibacillus phage P7.1]WNX21133.1 DUF1642 domain-containing protein [Lacticaseibacillus paracasei]